MMNDNNQNPPDKMSKKRRSSLPIITRIVENRVQYFEQNPQPSTSKQTEKVQKRKNNNNLVTNQPSTSKEVANALARNNNLLINQPSTSREVDNARALSPNANRIDLTSDSDSELDLNVLRQLYQVFPDAEPNYLKQICQQQKATGVSLDMMINYILKTDGNYPKRMKSPEQIINPLDQLEFLQETLPDANPAYLKRLCRYYQNDPNGFSHHIERDIEEQNYPKLRKCQSKKKVDYELNIEKFVKLFPKPLNEFNNPDRNVLTSSNCIQYARKFLLNHFNTLPTIKINDVFRKNKYQLYRAARELMKIKLEVGTCTLKHPRKKILLASFSESIPLLQEIYYIEHEDEINNFIQEKEQEFIAKKAKAIRQNSLKSCSCCFDQEILPEDCFSCEDGCEFCKDCIAKSSEIVFSESRLNFPCLNCSSSLSLNTLQLVLSPKLFSKIAQKKALKEIEAADIEDLVYCPFCDFATILCNTQKILNCLNPDCMVKSCRYCKEVAHIPLRCEEVEKDNELKARLCLEDKMTQGLLRTCWKCGVRYFKEEGCNKMTCSCGASMCYICAAPISNYEHFNGLGGNQHHKCPLYSDTNAINEQNVLKAAEEAKKLFGADELKVDPSANIRDHFEERRKKLPREKHLDLLDALRNNPH